MKITKEEGIAKKISIMLCIPLYICFPLWCCSRRVIYCFRSSSDNETGRRTKLRFLEAKAHEMKLFMVFLFPERCLGMRSFFQKIFSIFFRTEICDQSAIIVAAERLVLVIAERERVHVAKRVREV